MRTLIAIAITALAACTDEPTRIEPPHGYPAVNGLWQIPDSTSCWTIAEVSCAGDCAATCLAETFVACCHGKKCPAESVFYPSESAAVGVWEQCITEAVPACGTITDRCENVAPGFRGTP